MKTKEGGTMEIGVGTGNWDSRAREAQEAKRRTHLQDKTRNEHQRSD